MWVCVIGFGFRRPPAIPGWGVGLFVLVSALGFYPANPGWGVWCGCVFLGSGFGCAPQFLAGVLGCVFVCALRLYAASPGWGVDVCMCAWARVWAASRHFWLECWVVRFGVSGPPVPRQSWLRCAVWVCVLGLGFRLRLAYPRWVVWVFVLVCALRLYPANPGSGVWSGCVC